MRQQHAHRAAIVVRGHHVERAVLVEVTYVGGASTKGPPAAV